MRDPESSEFRMWYRTHHGEFPLPDGRVWQTALLYAASTDGIHWSKPALNIYEWQGSKANNILGAEMEMFGLLHEPEDPHPDRRYKAMMTTRGGYDVYKGIFNLTTSPDGLRWTKGPEIIAPMYRRQEPGYRGKQLDLGDTNSITFDQKLWLLCLAYEGVHRRQASTRHDGER